MGIDRELNDIDVNKLKDFAFFVRLIESEEE